MRKDFYINKLKRIKENLRKFIKDTNNLTISIFILIIGFLIILLQGNILMLILYILTLLWIILFNSAIFIKNPFYLLITFISLLIANAFRPLLTNSLNSLEQGNLLMFFIYLIVWVLIKIRILKMKKNSKNKTF
ncbi:MAG: hypothetical protein PHX15_02560 [Candidatus Nanoarchaeia archaeon]|jgi:hypothetical protein|nr:hypothetical protein [Candidatus Nanoarchaeia archaeon]MDD3994052.1 hypothetical protein [Candidatus Nanoarchaeia archaeon]MDD4563332.1 hypothetical protein [Candidatus Nanoarchaeia archaeon]